MWTILYQEIKQGTRKKPRTKKKKKKEMQRNERLKGKYKNIVHWHSSWIPSYSPISSSTSLYIGWLVLYENDGRNSARHSGI